MTKTKKVVAPKKAANNAPAKRVSKKISVQPVTIDAPVGIWMEFDASELEKEQTESRDGYEPFKVSKNSLDEIVEAEGVNSVLWYSTHYGETHGLSEKETKKLRERLEMDIANDRVELVDFEDSRVAVSGATLKFARMVNLISEEEFSGFLERHNYPPLNQTKDALIDGGHLHGKGSREDDLARMIDEILSSSKGTLKSIDCWNMALKLAETEKWKRLVWCDKEVKEVVLCYTNSYGVKKKVDRRAFDERIRRWKKNNQ